MIFSTAIPSDLNKQILDHLLRDDEQEDLCFVLWYPSHGKERLTALLQQPVFPKQGERQIHGNASFLPMYFERVLGLALEKNAGIAFIHSHLGPGWQGMSQDDVIAEKRIAAAVHAATNLPLHGLTLGIDGSWSARFWPKTASRTYDRNWCSSVRIVGESLSITFNEHEISKINFKPELSRTISAWGEDEQLKLMRLRVGIVGAGSVGSIVAESLSRIGVAYISIIDFDSVEQVNLDRILHSTRLDALLKRSKVKVLARGLKNSATANPFTLNVYENSIVEEDGFRAALDCDVIFSCVDRPWARSVLNFIAFAHLIPVIDGGIRTERKKTGNGLLRADWRAHTISPTRPCMECLGQYNSGDVAAERDGYLDDPSYIAGLPENHFIKRNANVFAFSLDLASLEIQHFLALTLNLPGGLLRKPQLYHFVQNTMEFEEKTCHTNCLFPSITALGDCAPIVVTGEHQAAIGARATRTRFHNSIHYWITLITNLAREKARKNSH
jgi:molybdopterin/thiamine biosynthesis adenylyltransferase